MPTPAASKKIFRDLAHLAKAPSEGIRVCDGWEDSIQDGVLCWVEGPRLTAYEGGFFQILFHFGNDYPTAPPKGYFKTKIVHPNVSPTDGSICVSALKKDWKSTLTISDLLITIKGLLFCPNAESALNEDAGRMMLEDWDLFFKRAKMSTSIHATPKSKPIEFTRVKDHVEGSSNAAPTSASTSAASSNTAPIPITPTVAASTPRPPTTAQTPMPNTPKLKSGRRISPLPSRADSSKKGEIYLSEKRTERSNSVQPLVAPPGNGKGTWEISEALSESPHSYSPIPSPINPVFPTSVAATPSTDVGSFDGLDFDVDMEHGATVPRYGGRKRTLTSSLLVDTVGGSNALKKITPWVDGRGPVMKRRTGLKRL